MYTCVVFPSDFVTAQPHSYESSSLVKEGKLSPFSAVSDIDSRNTLADIAGKRRLKDKVCHLDQAMLDKVNHALEISLELTF